MEINDWPDPEEGWPAHAPAGSFPANAYGLHEVHGNVWELCRDRFEEYMAGKQVDHMTTWTGVSDHVTRDGGFRSAAYEARSSSRSNGPPEGRLNNLGLRPARGIRPQLQRKTANWPESRLRRGRTKSLVPGL